MWLVGGGALRLHEVKSDLSLLMRLFQSQPQSLFIISPRAVEKVFIACPIRK